MLAKLLFIPLNPLFFLVFVLVFVAVIVLVCLWSQSPNLTIPQRALRVILSRCFLDSLDSVIIALDLKGEGVGSSEPSDCAICSILTELFSIQEL